MTDGVDFVNAPTEDPEDSAFLREYGPWLDHPLSWEPNARRYPEKFARVFTAIADAPGPILIHCAGGRDRTGMICSMLLVLADVEVDAVSDAYEEGFRRTDMYGGHGVAYDAASDTWATFSESAPTAEALTEAIAARRPALREWIGLFDVARYLREAGVDAQRLARLRELLR
jgi:hypothetical protein